MAEELDLHAKTEPPSPRRRERAREEGQFALSPELNSGVVLFAGVAGLLWLGQMLGAGLQEAPAQAQHALSGFSLPRTSVAGGKGD